MPSQPANRRLLVQCISCNANDHPAILARATRHNLEKLIMVSRLNQIRILQDAPTSQSHVNGECPSCSAVSSRTTKFPSMLNFQRKRCVGEHVSLLGESLRLSWFRHSPSLPRQQQYARMSAETSLPEDSRMSIHGHASTGRQQILHINSRTVCNTRIASPTSSPHRSESGIVDRNGIGIALPIAAFSYVRYCIPIQNGPSKFVTYATDPEGKNL